MDTSIGELFIRPMQLADAQALLDVRTRNRDFFSAFEPHRPDSHYTLAAQKEWIQQSILDRERDASYAFAICVRASGTQPVELIGRIVLSGVSRGPWQNANVGYFIDRSHNGNGYATVAVRLAAEYAFQIAGLHRLQAAVMPRNTASIRVLEKAGFRREGYATNYLSINHQWEDHLLYALTREDLEPAPEPNQRHHKDLQVSSRISRQEADALKLGVI